MPPAPHLFAGRAEALRDHAACFLRDFGGPRAPRLFFSPGRVNLMGAHLDYNGGPVLPTAIDRGTFLAVRPRTDRALVLSSTLQEGKTELDLDRLPDRPAGGWADYPIGVLKSLLAGSKAPHGLEILFGGNLPIGAGLSSSASICVGTAFAVDRVFGLGGDRRRAIDAALWGEREFVGVQCGIMDPFAVGFTRPGHLLWLDCKDELIEHLPLDTERVAIAVADTGVRRELAQSAFNERVSECRRAFEGLRRHVPEATCLRDVPLEVVEAHGNELEPGVRRRALHVAGEVRRTFAARESLRAGDLDGFGACITAAHESLRDLFEVSIPELDLLVEAALAWPGTFGSRLTGAGFGGCVVALVERTRCDGFAEHLAERFAARFGRRPAVEFFASDSGPCEVETSSAPE